MKHRLKLWLRQFAQRLLSYTRPDQDVIVMNLILSTSHLELTKQEFIEIAPLRGTCGPFRLTGNSLPVFHYRVFEKEIMEFILVRVEVAKPDRISYFSTIDSTTAPELHGNPVITKRQYRAPFEALSLHLNAYFPFYKKKVIQTESQDETEGQSS